LVTCILSHTNDGWLIVKWLLDVNDTKFFKGKFIIPEEGWKGIFSRINDAWRRFKHYIKREHYLKYSTLKDRLKHRPEEVPEPHFRRLLKFWDNAIIQVNMYIL